MREVILPGALPGIMTGLKITLAIAWSCVLSAEMVAAQDGLGALIWQAKDWGNLALVLVGMVCISITVLVADFAANRIEACCCPGSGTGELISCSRSFLPGIVTKSFRRGPWRPGGGGAGSVAGCR